MKYKLMKLREKFILAFWKNIPRSWLYWAVNEAWANATCTKFSDKHPDEVTWSMMQNFLSEKSK